MNNVLDEQYTLIIIHCSLFIVIVWLDRSNDKFAVQIYRKKTRFPKR